MISMRMNKPMQEIIYDDVFHRTFSYLRRNGVHLNRNSALATIKLFEELLIADSPDVMARVIVELPRRLEQTDLKMPMIAPPLNRGSIGYQDT
jgi:hypothetical protein